MATADMPKRKKATRSNSPIPRAAQRKMKADWIAKKANAPIPPAPEGRKSYKLEPDSLADLRGRCGPYADAVISYLEWGAVSGWLMKGDAQPSNPFDVVWLSVDLIQEARNYEMGMPTICKPRDVPALYGFSADSQREAIRTAEETFAEWEAAGRPNLTPRRCKDAYRYLQSAIRKGNAAPYPGSIEPNPELKETL